MNKIDNLTSDWKWSIGIIHLGFLPLFVGATFYYLERLSGCAAQDIFEVINSGSFFLIHNRLVHFFSQWLPLLCFHLGLKLSGVLLVFSASSVLHHYLFSMFCLFILKDRNAAVGILLVQYFGVTSSYYTNPHLEIQYCISLGIVLQSLLVTKELTNGFRWVLAVAVIFLLINSYLATAVFIPFVILLNWKHLGVRNLLVYVGAVLFSFGYKFAFLDTYVAGVLDFQLVNSTPDSHLEGVSLFIASFFNRRILELVAVLLLFILLIQKKSWGVFFLLKLFIVLYVSLIVHFYGDGTYSEHIGLPITFFIITTWVFVMSKFKKVPYVSMIALALFIILKSVIIFGLVGSWYSSQTNALLEVLRKTRCLPSSQVVLDDDSYDLPFSNQALYQRSLLYSKAMGRKNCVGIMVRDGVVNNLTDLGVHMPHKQDLKPDEYANDYFLNWLNSKADEISIDSDVFPMKDDGFILIDESELCIVDS